MLYFAACLFQEEGSPMFARIWTMGSGWVRRAMNVRGGLAGGAGQGKTSYKMKEWLDHCLKSLPDPEWISNGVPYAGK
jgi:hypothetical protein